MEKEKIEQTNDFNLGDIVCVLDKIDMQHVTFAVVKRIEADDEIEGLFYLYLVAHNQELNINYQDGIYYWTIIESCNPYLSLIARATNE